MQINLRIKEYPQGFVVEIQKRKWHGKKYWTHYISVSGIESPPWYFKTYNNALVDLQDKIRWNVNENSF